MTDVAAVRGSRHRSPTSFDELVARIVRNGDSYQGDVVARLPGLELQHFLEQIVRKVR